MESTYLAHYGIKGMKWGVRKADRLHKKQQLAKQTMESTRKAYWDGEPGASFGKVKRAESSYIKASNKALKASGKTNKEMWQLNKDLSRSHFESSSAKPLGDTEKRLGSSIINTSKTASRLKEYAKPYAEFDNLQKADRAKFEDYCRKGVSDDWDKAAGTKGDYGRATGLSKQQFIKEALDSFSRSTYDAGEDRYIRETRKTEPDKWRKEYNKASSDFKQESSKLVKKVLGEYGDMKPKGWSGASADYVFQTRLRDSLEYPSWHKQYD